MRSGVRRSADLYINLCSLAERLCKRKEAIAGEYNRFSLNLTALTETSADAYALDTNDVPLLNEGMKGTAKHLGISQQLLEDESRAWDLGLIEDLKTVRDGLVSMREMFDRKDRYARDNIPQLEARIQKNEGKLQGIKAKGDAAKPGEAEKVENAIVNVRPTRSIFEREPTMLTHVATRTNNPSSPSTPAVSSSRSACATNCCTSPTASTASPACTRTGCRSASSTRSCRRIAGVGRWMRWRGCRWAIRGRAVWSADAGGRGGVGGCLWGGVWRGLCLETARGSGRWRVRGESPPLRKEDWRERGVGCGCGLL